MKRQTACRLAVDYCSSSLSSSSDIIWTWEHRSAVSLAQALAEALADEGLTLSSTIPSVTSPLFRISLSALRRARSASV